jgi:hypothetical protein
MKKPNAEVHLFTSIAIQQVLIPSCRQSSYLDGKKKLNLWTWNQYPYEKNQIFVKKLRWARRNRHPDVFKCKKGRERESYPVTQTLMDSLSVLYSRESEREGETEGERDICTMKNSALRRNRVREREITVMNSFGFWWRNCTKKLGQLHREMKQKTDGAEEKWDGREVRRKYYFIE